MPDTSVFISYSREPAGHTELARKLAERLKKDGLDCRIDQFCLNTTPQWMQKQASTADFVLVVCSEPYKLQADSGEPRGNSLGVVWEWNAIQNRCYVQRSREMVIPIVLQKGDEKFRPNVLSGETYYRIPEKYQDLLNRLNAREPKSESAKARPPQIEPAPVWNVPHRRNKNFTGREEALEHLRNELTSCRPAAVTQALAGLGGIGKTQLAVEYAWRHRKDYSVVWWVRCEDPATLTADYAGLARELNLPEKESQDQTVTVQAVRKWLETNSGWLLVFDNVPEPASIKNYLPGDCQGNVLITSRHPNWKGVAEPLALPVLPRDKSVEFLLKRAGRNEKDDAGQLADDLGCLPLALEQAAAYIEETGCTIAHYGEVFRTQRAEALKRPSKTADYPDSVATTWSVSFKRLAEQSPAAAELLNLASCLAPDDIPLDLLIPGIPGKQQEKKESPAQALLPKALAEAVRDSVEWDNAKAALRGVSLAEFSDDRMTVHRLVQAVTWDRMDAKKQRECAEAAAGLVNNAFPYDSDDFRTWPDCARLLAHAQAAAVRAEALDVALKAVGRILNQVGLYLQGRAQYEPALVLFERLPGLFERAYGKDDPNVATSLNNLAALYFSQGKYPEAEPLSLRALGIREKALGPEHPDVANSLNNLAALYRTQGKYAEAEPLYQRALAVRERVLGTEHPDVAQSLNNLALLYANQGKYAEAEPLHQRALKIREKVLGPAHPDVATSLDNLALLYVSQGKYAEAEPLFQRALKIDEKALGKEHPGVATDLNNLAGLYYSQDRFAEAEPLYQRALGIMEKALGKDHPNTKTAAGNLALLREEMRKGNGPA